MIGNFGTDPGPGLAAAILRAPLTVTPDTPIKAAVTAMSRVRGQWETTHNPDSQAHIELEARASCVVVVDQGRVVGIFTERDVVRLSCQNIFLDQQPIRDYMIQPVTTLKESELSDVFATVQLLQAQQIRHLPIVDEQGYLTGLVTHETLRLLTRPIDLLRLRVVADVMTGNVICAAPEDTVLRIAEIMADQAVSSVVIVDRPSSQAPGQIQPVGLLTERDLVQFQALDLSFATTPAVDVMSSPVFTVSPQASLWDVHQLMAQHLIRRVVVTGNQGELLGIVTQSSLLQVFNPWEFYKLAAVLAAKVNHLEAENTALHDQQVCNLEQQLAEHTARIAEQADAENERLRQRLEFLVRTSPTVIYSCWPDGDYGMTYITENTQDILGYAATAITENSNFWLDRIHPDDVAYVLAHHRFVVSTRSTQSIEYRFRHRQGYYIWLRDQMTIVRDKDGNSIELVGAIANITEHRNFEEKLRANTIHLRNAQRIGKIGSWEFDVKSEAIAWSEEVFRLFGYSPNSRLPTYQELQDLIHPQDIEPFVSSLNQAIANGKPYEIECGFYRLDHTQGYFLARGEPVRNHLGQVIKLVGTILDITERKRTELELQARTAELDRFFSLSIDLMYIGSTDGIILRLNQQWHTTFGYELSELEGKHYIEFVHPDDLARSLVEEQKLTHGQSIQAFKHRFRCQDGSYRWLEWRAVQSGHLNFGVARDVTDTQEVENAIKRQLKAMEIAIDGIGILQDEKYIFLNQSYVTMFGYDHAAELLGQSWKNLYSPAEIVRFELDILPRLRQNRFWQGEAIGQRKDGSQFDQGLSLALVDDVTMLCVCRDITPQKQTEKAMREQADRERLLREITQRIRQSLNLNGIFSAACEDVRRVLGADRVMVFKFDPRSNHEVGTVVAESVLSEFDPVLHAEVQDHCFGEKFAPLYIQGHYAVMSDISSLEECHSSVLSRFQVKSNMVMPLICGEGLWGLLCVHECSQKREWQQSEIDLTQQIALQLGIAIQQADLFEQVQEELNDRQLAQEQLTEKNKQLAISNQELQRATRLKDEFLANMSHELRTPLNAILGMAEGLQEKIFGPITGQQLTAIQTIERSGSHLLELINDILDLAKVESGQLELDQAPTAINTLCQSSLTFIKQAALKKRLTIDLQIPDNLPNVLVDERRMRQVLINLLNNAVKFTPEGGRISLEVLLLPQAPLDSNPSPAYFLRVAIRDTGIGIPTDQMDRLFQPFVQIDSALNRKYMGTGLGLALVRRIVELHGGQVSLTSQVGVGSCFMVDLPYLPSQQPALPVLDLVGVSSESNSATTGLILLAEDNDANTSTISSYLMAKGYRLMVAKNGLEAIRLAEAELPDLILMDIQMPEMDGLEATEKIRQLPNLRQIPIIALTALAMSGDQERCLAAGATAYLSKPVKLKELANRVKQLLRPSDPPH